VAVFAELYDGAVRQFEIVGKFHADLVLEVPAEQPVVLFLTRFPETAQGFRRSVDALDEKVRLEFQIFVGFYRAISTQ
jgi:hypothetical protein